MNKRHGSPYDRGSADAYYGRPCRPHYFLGDTYNSTEITADRMTPQEIEEYNVGYRGETDRKDWGFYDEVIETEYDRQD
jgi:hypothetical protein